MLLWDVCFGRQLSKFTFPALVPLLSTRRQLRKMATSGERKSFCVLNFHVNKCVVSVQRHFRTKFGTDPPSGKSIWKWYLLFQDIVCIFKKKNKKSTGRPSTEEEAVERVRTSFVGSRTDALATTFPRSHPVWFILVGFHQGSCFYTTTSSDAGWPTRAHHSSHHSDWPRHATKGLAGIWLPTWCVSWYGWSIYWAFVMCLNETCDFSFYSILILCTSVILNSSNKLLKSGTSFWLDLYNCTLFLSFVARHARKHYFIISSRVVNLPISLPGSYEAKIRCDVRQRPADEIRQNIRTFIKCRIYRFIFFF
jgi:hypothetical protein